MIFLSFAQIIIFIMGAVAFGMSVYFFGFFAKAAKGDGIAFAMRTFLIEQMISSSSVLYFSFNAFYQCIILHSTEDWNNNGPEIVTFLRACIFGAMICSTAKLAVEIIKIQKEKEQQEHEKDKKKNEN